jgi:hypothetical protein
MGMARVGLDQGIVNALLLQPGQYEGASDLNGAENNANKLQLIITRANYGCSKVISALANARIITLSKALRG